ECRADAETEHRDHRCRRVYDCKDGGAGKYRGAKAERAPQPAENQSAEDEFLEDRCGTNGEQGKPRELIAARKGAFAPRLEKMRVGNDVEIDKTCHGGKRTAKDAPGTARHKARQPGGTQNATQ